MIFNHNFHTQLWDIHLQTKENFKKEVISDIALLIEYINSEFDKTNPESSKRRFLDSPLNFPTQFDSVFLKYVKTMMSIEKKTKGKVDHFGNTKVLHIDDETNTITKLEKKAWTPETFLLPFLIENIAEYLKENEAKIFTIASKNYLKGVGSSDWDININKNISIRPNDEAIFLIKSKELTNAPFSNKFGVLNTKIVAESIAIESKDLLYSQAISSFLPNFSTLEEYASFAQSYKVNLSIFTKEKKIYRV